MLDFQTSCSTYVLTWVCVHLTQCVLIPHRALWQHQSVCGADGGHAVRPLLVPGAVSQVPQLGRPGDAHQVSQVRLTHILSPSGYSALTHSCRGGGGGGEQSVIAQAGWVKNLRAVGFGIFLFRRDWAQQYQLLSAEIINSTYSAIWSFYSELSLCDILGHCYEMTPFLCSNFHCSIQTLYL